MSGDVCRRLRCSNGDVESGNDRLFPCGRVDPKTKNDGRHERPNARESFAHDGDKHVDERKPQNMSFSQPLNLSFVKLCVDQWNDGWTESVGK